MKKLETRSMNEVADAPSAVAYSDVQRMIVHVRNQQVIIDADVAKLYGVETKRINEAVRNNPDKFPADYMFALTADESAILRSKFSSLEHGGTGKFPADYMFMLTEDELSDLRSRFLTANARAANPPRNAVRVLRF